MAAQFRIRDKDLKQYPHFDKPLSADELSAIVRDPERVRSNAFFPFIQYTKKYQPFRSKVDRPAPKARLIRFASRRDAAIFSYYRHLLSEAYEASLTRIGIADVPIAYRKLPLTDAAGKCNIDFAHDAVTEILRQRNCMAVTLDISQYFENIDHQRLYTVWRDLLGAPNLPADHLAVFRAITRYTVVDRDELYERLGFRGPVQEENGTWRHGYLRSYREMPKQLCSVKEFREKVMGGDARYPSLAAKNENSFGIPQGAPISDLLANAYLMDFDAEVAAYVVARGGWYRRYSDDLLLVLPGDAAVGRAANVFVTEAITRYGDQLRIKASKSAIVRFWDAGDPDGLQYELVAGAQGRNGLEYLGFRFDGRRVYLRDSTLGNFYRKITRRARREARRHAARYTGKSVDWLMEHFDYAGFERRFGRVRDFERLADRRSWTFWTYARRASERFGHRGTSIYQQVHGYRNYIRRAVGEELQRQMQRSETRPARERSVSRSSVPRVH